MTNALPQRLPVPGPSHRPADDRGTGHGGHSFALDLVAGRAVRDAEEFAVGCQVPTRCRPTAK